MAQEGQQGHFRIATGHAKVHVADHMAGSGEHDPTLMCLPLRHKSRHLPGMSLETRSTLRVRYAETDQMGVVYHANYLVWCEIGRTDFIRSAGRSYADLEREGVRLAVSDATLRFRASARYDDPILVRTTLDHVGSRGMTFVYRIEHAETHVVLVTATTSLVSVTPEGRPVSIPADVRAWLDAAWKAQPDGGDAP